MKIQAMQIGVLEVILVAPASETMSSTFATTHHQTHLNAAQIHVRMGEDVQTYLIPARAMSVTVEVSIGVQTVNTYMATLPLRLAMDVTYQMKIQFGT